MSYKNDGLLVIVNKYGKSSSDAKAELFETYDKLRDLTASGPSIAGSQLGGVGNAFLNIARLFAPASFTANTWQFSNECTWNFLCSVSKRWKWNCKRSDVSFWLQQP